MFRPEVLKQVLNFRQYPLYLKSRGEFWLKKRGFDWIFGGLKLTIRQQYSLGGHQLLELQVLPVAFNQAIMRFYNCLLV